LLTTGKSGGCRIVALASRLGIVHHEIALFIMH